MPRKKYYIDLNSDERRELLDLAQKTKKDSRRRIRAQILLLADEGFKDQDIMKELHISRPCVERIRKKFVEGGMDKAINENPRPGQKRKLDFMKKASLTALTNSTAPIGREGWSFRLLASKLVELGIVESISHETVRQELKNELKP